MTILGIDSSGVTICPTSECPDPVRSVGTFCKPDGTAIETILGHSWEPPFIGLYTFENNGRGATTMKRLDFMPVGTSSASDIAESLRGYDEGYTQLNDDGEAIDFGASD